jgi:alanyl-tRNA synthetase
VKIYSMLAPGADEPYSFEICGGPHVENTSELEATGTFKILKEEASSAGIRRIKAVLV